MPPGIATQVKAGMKAGGKAAEKATRNIKPTVGMRMATMGMRMTTIGKRMPTHGNRLWTFPIQNGVTTTTLTTLSTTGQRASTATQPGTHGTKCMHGHNYR